MHFHEPLSGTLAGEVQNPRRSFPLSLFFLIPIVVSQTVVPLALALGVNSDLSNYSVGYFSTIGKHVAGEYLSVMITSGAIIAQLGQANGGSLISDESLQSFALRKNAAFFTRRARSRRAWVRWLFDTEFRIAPVFVIFDGLLLALFVWVSVTTVILSVIC